MQSKIAKVLYVGPLEYGGTCLQRFNALQKIGFSVTGLDTATNLNRSFLKKVVDRVKSKVFFQKDVVNANRRVINLIESSIFNILWVDKGLHIKPETLLKIKSISPDIILISFSPDDMINPGNQSKEYLECLPIYDYHITTKSFNVSELKELGAKHVLMMDNGYSEEIHHPVHISPILKDKIGGEVGFIGFWEKEREDYITHLAENNISVRIWGPWPKNRKYHNNIKVEGKVAWGDDYAKTICSFDINLCFLRKVNRDLQTTRSIEIPACRAFMLGERSIEHERLFSEGKEAVYFSSKEELLEKVEYYLKNEKHRIKIAEAGYRRCLSDGYSYNARLTNIIEKIYKETQNELFYI